MMISPDDPPSEPSPTEPRGNPVARLIITHWILGSALGIVCAGLLLLLDPLHIRPLLMRSDAMIPALAMLFVGFGTTFGAIVSATAVMTQKKDDDDDKKPPSGGSRARIAAPALAPARVRAGGAARVGRF